MNRATRLLLGLMIALGPISVVPDALAASIHVQNTFAEGFGTFGDIQHDTDTSSGAAVSLSRTYNSTSTLLNPTSGLIDATGQTSGAASANGVFDATGLRLGASGSGTVTASGLSGTSYSGQAMGFVHFTDEITLLGGLTGEATFLRLVFDIDGSFAAFEDDTLKHGGAGASLSFGIGTNLDSAGFNTDLVDNGLIDPMFAGSFGTNPPPAVFSADLAVLFGVPTTLNVSLTTLFTGSFNDLDGSGTAIGSTDFDSTFTLRLAQVVDSTGNPIAGGQVVSSSGLVYPNGAAAAVPYPPAALLLAVAVASFVAFSGCRRMLRSR